MNYVDMGLEAITQKSGHASGAEAAQPNDMLTAEKVAIGIAVVIGGAIMVLGAAAAWGVVKKSGLSERRKQLEADFLARQQQGRGGGGRPASAAATEASKAVKRAAAKQEETKKGKKRVCERTWQIVGRNPDGTPQYGDVARWVDVAPTDEEKAAAKAQAAREQKAFDARLVAVNEVRAVAHLPPITPPEESQSKDPEGWKAFRQELRDWEARIPRYEGQEQLSRRVPGQDPRHAKCRGLMRCVNDASGTGQNLMRSSRYFARK